MGARTTGADGALTAQANFAAYANLFLSKDATSINRRFFLINHRDLLEEEVADQIENFEALTQSQDALRFPPEEDEDDFTPAERMIQAIERIEALIEGLPTDQQALKDALTAEMQGLATGMVNLVPELRELID